MDLSKSLPARRFPGAVVLLLFSACAGSEQPAPAPTRSVCSECPGLTGGESSDFGGGSVHTCVWFEERTTIDDARASELGFDTAKLTALIEREFDAPLRWTESTTHRGGSPRGYRQQTRIEGRAWRGAWLTYVGLDPTRCEGTTCNDDEVGEWTCSDRLELGVEAELRTLDGAVSATVSGYVLQGREGFPFASPAGSQRADLRDVTGSLELFPPDSTSIEFALLMVDLYFRPERIEGELRPYFRLSGGPGASDYVPLNGQWPATE